MKTVNWDPKQGDALQGDVCLFQLPKGFEFSKKNEIKAKNNDLILAEGEVTGHHHAIRLPEPTMFREDGGGSGLDIPVKSSKQISKLADLQNLPADAKIEATIKMYKDDDAVNKLVGLGYLTTPRLAIGFLSIEGNTVVLRHDEHDAIRIPPGNYYVGNQQEWDAGEARRVAD